MAFSSAGRSGPLADINVTPLVDVMLVLLIIFIVTAPIVARPIPVQLPQATDRTIDRPEPPPPIELRLDASNQLSWDGQPMAIGDLQGRLQAQAGEHAGNLPELRIATEPAAEDEGMARILAAAEATGMERMAFVRGVSCGESGNGRPAIGRPLFLRGNVACDTGYSTRPH